MIKVKWNWQRDAILTLYWCIIATPVLLGFLAYSAYVTEKERIEQLKAFCQEHPYNQACFTLPKEK